MTWKISSNRGVCTGCQKDFNEEEPYISNIVDSEEFLERRDYCIPCWEGIDTADSFYFWKSVFRPRRKKSLFVDDDTLMNFFTRLAEEDSDLKKNFRYLLSLILMRKKLLNFTDVFKEGENEYLVLKGREDREYRVLNPRLDESEIEEVKIQMMSVLNEDLFDEETPE
jgi:hypothetical protein